MTKTFSAFRDAILSHDGPSAAEYVDQKSLKFYDQLRQDALTLNREALEQEPLSRRIQVLLVRRLHSGEELAAMTGRELVESLVNKGELLFKMLEGDVRVGSPIYHEDRSYLKIYRNTAATRIRFAFVQEDDSWKIDLKALDSVSKKTYEGIMEDKEMTEEQLISEIVSEWHDIPEGRDLWEPLIRPGKASATELPAEQKPSSQRQDKASAENTADES